MKYKIKQTGKTQKRVEFHISKDIIARELDRIYQEISKTASLPGFRTGKAPIEVIKNRYSKEAQKEVVEKLLSDSFRKAIGESNIEVLGLPEVSDLHFDEGQGMSYKAVVNIRPQIKLKGYKRLNLKRKNIEVKESDVDEQINALRETNSKFVPKTGTAVIGNYAICDVECSIEGAAIEKKENVWLYIGDDGFIPGKELVGVNINDEKDIEKALPKDYSKKEVAGKKANFHIKVKEIKEKILPELNDEFITSMGNFSNIAELREGIKKALERKNEIETKRQLEDQSLHLLNKMAVFDVPQFMVDRHLELLVNETKERLKKENYSEDEIKSMEKDFKERLSKEAVRQVRAYFILDEISRLENITVDDKEIENTFNTAASSSGRSVDEIKKHYEKNNLIEDLKEEIKQRKVLDFLIENARIAES
jgi:trigger factor